MVLCRMTSTPSLETLTDQVLLGQFGDLVREDRQNTACLLRHIDAIDRRKIWAKYGHPSLFDFLVTRHHMSESTAGKRIGAARTARQFPVLFDMVARGEIHLSGIHRIKAHLTPENHEAVLAQAKHKTIRAIEQLVAHLAPQPDVPSTLRAIPTRTTLTPAIAPPAAGSRAQPVTPPSPVPRRSPDPAPLSPGRYRLQVTLGEDACNKLKQLTGRARHKHPSPAPPLDQQVDAPASKPPCVARYGPVTTVAVASSAKTVTAATKLAVSSLPTCIRGPRAARTPRPISASGASRTTPLKPNATTAHASWPASASGSR